MENEEGLNAIVTEVMLRVEDANLGYVAAGVVTVLNSLAWAYWYVGAKTVFGYRWIDIPFWQMGFFGYVSQGKFKKIYKGRYLDLFAPAKRFASYEQ